jgi:hypothetical protein
MQAVPFIYMQWLKLAGYTFLILFGISLFIYGEYDDSPGGQLLGALVALGGIVGIVRGKKKWA